VTRIGVCKLDSVTSIRVQTYLFLWVPDTIPHISRASAKPISVLQGAVANFVESEQIVVLEDKQGNITTSSFVQIRGSIPLLWSQIPNIKYKPPTRIAPPTDSHPAFDRHFKELLETYQVTFIPPHALVPVIEATWVTLDTMCKPRPLWQSVCVGLFVGL